MTKDKSVPSQQKPWTPLLKTVFAAGVGMLLISVILNFVIASHIATHSSMDSLAWTTGWAFIILPALGFNFLYFGSLRRPRLQVNTLLLASIVFAINFFVLLAAAWLFLAADPNSSALGSIIENDTVAIYPFAPLVILAACGFMYYFSTRTTYKDVEASYLESGKASVEIKPLPLIVHFLFIIFFALIWAFLVLVPILAITQPDNALWGSLLMFGGEAPEIISEYSDLWTLSAIYGILFGAILSVTIMSFIKKLLYRFAPVGPIIENPRSSLWQRLSTFQPYVAAIAGLLATIGARVLLEDDDAGVFVILLVIAAVLLVLCVVIIICAKKFGIKANKINIAQSLLSPQRWN